MLDATAFAVSRPCQHHFEEHKFASVLHGRCPVAVARKAVVYFPSSGHSVLVIGLLMRELLLLLHTVRLPCCHCLFRLRTALQLLKNITARSQGPSGILCVSAFRLCLSLDSRPAISLRKSPSRAPTKESPSSGALNPLAFLRALTWTTLVRALARTNANMDDCV